MSHISTREKIMVNQAGEREFTRELTHVSQNWGWFLALGVILILLGIAVVGSTFVATIFSIILLGLFLIAGGVVQVIQAFLANKWSGLFLSLLLGILYIVVGVLCVARPTITALNLTLLIAAFCFVAGLFRMLSSVLIRFEKWGWVFFNGFVTFLLGLIIYSDWPVSGLWVIGLFIGIDMILSGWSWVLLSIGARISRPKAIK
jgi:uncharacterized membrane protein HdeD (DUF308 family)